MLTDFKISFTIGFNKKYAIPLCFPPNINYVATLPCKTLNVTFIILPLQLLQKLTSKFIYFVLNVIHIIWHITITYFWLSSNYLSCARSVVSSLSSSKTMGQLNERAKRPCQCLPFLKRETPTFISPGLWLQHPHLNPVNYNILHRISVAGLP